MRPHAFLVVACCLAACGASDDPARTAPPEPRVEDRAEPVAETPEPLPEPVVGGPCRADADCGWDDECVARACVAGPAPSPVCEETAPPPGTCGCFAGRCALRPTAPPEPAPEACEGYGPRACGLDVGHGTCVAGRPNDLAGADRRWTGPRCNCDSRPPRRCLFEWVDPVPCESVDDCWVEVDPSPRPVARPAALRGRAFRPCRDGELAPACQEGECTLQGFSC